MTLVLVCTAAFAAIPAVESSMETTYARHFTLDYCEGGYQLISVINNKNEVVQRFLTIPEGAEVPADLDEDIVPLQLPLNNLLISSTPTTSLINAIGALETVSMTTTDYAT